MRKGQKTKPHGHRAPDSSTASEYKAWADMKARCENPRHKSYRNYGGRGIRVFHGWIDSFVPFFEHIGPKPSKEYTLERIDNSRGYEPGNVKWATMDAQCRNRRGNVRYRIGERMVLLPDLADELGINRSTLYYRIRRGATLQEAIARPVVKRGRIA